MRCGGWLGSLAATRGVSRMYAYALTLSTDFVSFVSEGVAEAL